MVGEGRGGESGEGGGVLVPTVEDRVSCLLGMPDASGGCLAGVCATRGPVPVYKELITRAMSTSATASTQK